MKSTQKTHKNLNQLLQKLATNRATELATTVQSGCANKFFKRRDRE